MMATPGRCADTGQAFSHGTKERFVMAVETRSTTRGNPIPAAGAVVALAAMMAGCATNYAPLSYTQEAHAQQVAAWCYSNFGYTTASQEGRDCVDRAWFWILDSDCQSLNKSCTREFYAFYGTGRYHAPYYATRGRIEK
jgi:hypothetical protein